MSRMYDHFSLVSTTSVGYNLFLGGSMAQVLTAIIVLS